jgi:hypothetical protein
MFLISPNILLILGRTLPRELMIPEQDFFRTITSTNMTVCEYSLEYLSAILHNIDLMLNHCGYIIYDRIYQKEKFYNIIFSRYKKILNKLPKHIIRYIIEFSHPIIGKEGISPHSKDLDTVYLIIHLLNV